MSDQIISDIKSKIRTVPDWPKQGILFRDVTTLLKDKKGFSEVIELLAKRYSGEPLDYIVGIEARGFIIGAALAYKLNVGFVPIRKKGKLPSKTITLEYNLEYGRDKIEIHADAITPGNQIVLVDDLIATGGTALAACQLLDKLKANIIECCFIVDLPSLGGRKRLEDSGYKVATLVEFERD